MRKVLVASVVFFLLFTYGLILSQIHVSVFPEALEPLNANGFYDYRGVTNIHTTRGIGAGSPAEAIRSAQEAGLDFLFITDLNAFEESLPVPEGYHRQLLVTTADVISYLESRLIFYDRLRQHSIASLGQAQVLLADLLSQSGADAEPDLIFLSHPSQQGFSWTGPYPSGLDGIEVLNLRSIWQGALQKSKISFAWSALVYPFNPALALLRLIEEPAAELQLWDQLAMSRRTLGMAGSEASARSGTTSRMFIRFPGYQQSFGLLSNHVLLRSELTGEPEGDRRKILSALASGQFYMCLDVLGNPKGFTTYIQDGEKVLPMGSRVKWTAGQKIVVKIPRRPRVPFEAALIKDGQHIMSSNSLDTEFELHGKGVYRVIIRVFPTLTLPDGQRWMTWIYSNPFYVE